MAQSSPDGLTPRQREVLELMASGVMSNQAIAEHLVISENTVKYHVAALLQTTKTHSRAELVAKIIRQHAAPSERGTGQTRPWRPSFSSSKEGILCGERSSSA